MYTKSWVILNCSNRVPSIDSCDIRHYGAFDELNDSILLGFLARLLVWDSVDWCLDCEDERGDNTLIVGKVFGNSVGSALVILWIPVRAPVVAKDETSCFGYVGHEER